MNLDGEIIDIDVPGAKLNPEGGFMIGFESSLGKPQQQARLAHAYIRSIATRIPDNDELEHEIVVVGHLFLRLNNMSYHESNPSLTSSHSSPIKIYYWLAHDIYGRFREISGW